MAKIINISAALCLLPNAVLSMSTATNQNDLQQAIEVKTQILPLDSIISDVYDLYLNDQDPSQSIDFTQRTDITHSNLYFFQTYAATRLGDNPQSCNHDKQCDQYPYYRCNIKSDDGEKYCGHKNVWPPTPLEVTGLATFSFVMALCVVAGIGGGGIAVSLIIAFFKFTTKPAVAISSFSILINSIMRYAYNWKTKHPTKKGMVLVDYSLATVMSPTTLAGSQIGGLVLKVFPALYIQVLLTLLLGLLGVQSARKGWELHKKEEAEKKTGCDSPKVESVENAPNPDVAYKGGVNKSTLTNRPTANSEISMNRPTAYSEISEVEEEKGSSNFVQIGERKFRLGVSPEQDQELIKLKKIVDAEQGHLQIVKQFMVWFMIFCVIMMNLMLGSSSFDSIVGIKECTVSYWMVQLVFVVICVIVTIVSIKINKGEQNLKINQD